MGTGVQMIWIATFPVVAFMAYNNMTINKAIEQHVRAAMGRARSWQPIQLEKPIAISRTAAAAFPVPAFIRAINRNLATEILPWPGSPYNVLHQLSSSELVME